VSEAVFLGEAGFFCVRTSVTVIKCRGKKATVFYRIFGCFRGRDKIASWMLKTASLLFSPGEL